MGKRGRKSYEESGCGLVPIHVIAKRMGISERNAQSIWKSAQEKLRKDPNAFSILLECVHGVAASEQELVRCSSVECDQEYIAKFASK
jgi:hypothetical protein